MIYRVWDFSFWLMTRNTSTPVVTYPFTSVFVPALQYEPSLTSIVIWASTVGKKVMVSLELISGVNLQIKQQ